MKLKSLFSRIGICPQFSPRILSIPFSSQSPSVNIITDISREHSHEVHLRIIIFKCTQYVFIQLYKMIPYKDIINTFVRFPNTLQQP